MSQGPSPLLLSSTDALLRSTPLEREYIRAAPVISPWRVSRDSRVTPHPRVPADPGLRNRSGVGPAVFHWTPHPDNARSALLDPTSGRRNAPDAPRWSQRGDFSASRSLLLPARSVSNPEPHRDPGEDPGAIRLIGSNLFGSQQFQLQRQFRTS